MFFVHVLFVIMIKSYFKNVILIYSYITMCFLKMGKYQSLSVKEQTRCWLF